MENINFVTASKMQTIEDYGAALITGMISLKTLESFHFEAHKKGLLDEDEEETSKTICWEIQRLLALYQEQMKHVLDRSQVKQEDILAALKTLAPDIKLPRKRKKKDGG